jgi:hypothetical protein
MSLVPVLFGGSRSLSFQFSPLVSAVARAAVSAGCCVRVGCASGADAATVSALHPCPSSLSVFAVGGSTGIGFPSSPHYVQQGFPFSTGFRLASLAAQFGAQVTWWAGGGPRVPIRARLAIRSRRAAAGCPSSVFFLSSPGSRGSLLAASVVAGAGGSVFAFCCGFSGPPAPLPGQSGAWFPVSPVSWFQPFVSRFGCPCFVWQPSQSSQPALF